MNITAEQVQIAFQNTVRKTHNKSLVVRKAIENTNKKPIAFGEANGLGTTFLNRQAKYGTDSR